MNLLNEQEHSFLSLLFWSITASRNPFLISEIQPHYKYAGANQNHVSTCLWTETAVENWASQLFLSSLINICLLFLIPFVFFYQTSGSRCQSWGKNMDGPKKKEIINIALLTLLSPENYRAVRVRRRSYLSPAGRSTEELVQRFTLWLITALGGQSDIIL